ncbi:glycosyltransferase family 2 protein [bacterium]|nr:MAG: glycosyltransferase family 2 protein [bacterium]
MILSVIVPFYDEEAAIEPILRRCMAAVEELRRGRPDLAEVEVIAVDDGSRDASAERAAAVPGVRLVRHEKNRGYGAALKSGFAQARGGWLAFLDADGTCCPLSLGGLLDKALAEQLDVVIGARLHRGSKMPAFRVAGNRVFRALVRALGGAEASDVASGIRVLRREAYEELSPLPDGMDFSPAMSARALLDPALRLGEAPVWYDGRVGDSKLSALRDGLRFVKVILDAGLVYRPRAFFGWCAALLSAAALLLFALPLGGPEAPLAAALRGSADEWMYFRVILIAVFVSLAAFLTALGLVAQSLVGVIHRGRDGALVGPGRSAALTRLFPAVGSALFVVGLAANAAPLAAYWRTGHIAHEYWLRPIVGGVLTAVGIQLAGFWVAARIAGLVWERRRAGSPP